MRATIVSTSNLKPVSITFPCLSFFSVLSWSGDSDKGVTAYEKGDYKTTLREWTPLVEEGDALAQVKMSASYVLGQGVLKDYVYAHMWGNIAASNGNENGAKLRDNVAEFMTPGDISSAQRLSLIHI